MGFLDDIKYKVVMNFFKTKICATLVKKSWRETTSNDDARTSGEKRSIRVTTILVDPYTKLESGVRFEKNKTYSLDELDGYW